MKMMSKELKIPMNHVTEVVLLSYGLSEIYCNGGVRDCPIQLMIGVSTRPFQNIIGVLIFALFVM